MAGNKDNNSLLYNDDLTNVLDHIEVRDLVDYKKITWKRWLSNLFIRGFTNSSAAIDDSYNVFSSFASHGVALSNWIFLLLGAILTFNYFIISRRQHSDARESFQESMRTIGNNIIPIAQYRIWKNQLSLLDENKMAVDIEQTVKNSRPEDLLKCIIEEFEHANRLRDDFLRFYDDDKTIPSESLLQNQKQTFLFIHSQIGLNAEAVAWQIKKNTEIRRVLRGEPKHQAPPSQTWSQRIRAYVDELFRIIHNNYMDVFSGITLAGTFGAIVLSFVGTSLMTLYPWNFLFATTLVCVAGIGSFCAKRYFRERIKELLTNKKNLIHSIHNKQLLVDLIVTTKQYRKQLNLAIVEFYNMRNQFEGSPTLAKELSEELYRTLKKIAASTRSPSAEEDYQEVAALKGDSHQIHLTLGYTLPVIFALGTGYGIGATLLQISLLAGLVSSLLPFIVIGLVGMVWYSIDAFYTAHCMFVREQEKINNLNTSVISKERISALESRLKLNQRYGLMHNDKLYSLQQYLKVCTNQSVKEDLLKELTAMREQFEQLTSTANNAIFDEQTTLKLSQIQQQLLDRLDSRTYKLNNKQLASQLETFINNKQPHKTAPKERVAPMSIQAYALFLSAKIGDYLNRNLRVIFDGMTFGLSASASLLFIFGSASLFTFTTTITVLIVGGLFGTLIALGNRHVLDYQQSFKDDRKMVKATLADKAELAEMLVITLQTRDEIRNLVDKIRATEHSEAIIESEKRKHNSRTGVQFDNEPLAEHWLHEHPDKQYSSVLVELLARSLTVTLKTKQSDMTNQTPVDNNQSSIKLVN